MYILQWYCSLLQPCILYTYIHVLLQQVYKVYCELSGSTGGCHRKQIHYPTPSTPRTSITSLSARRGSRVSIQSGEQPQIMRQCSDAAGVAVHRRNSELTMGPGAKVTFSPILEHKDEQNTDIDQHENTSMVDQEKEISQKNNIASAGQNEATTDVGHDEKITIDQDKKTTNVDQEEEENTVTNFEQDDLIMLVKMN